MIEPDHANHLVISHLHHLTPVGIGSMDVQSFTAYLTALAHSHSSLLRDLLVAEVLPRLKTSGTYSNGRDAGFQLTTQWWKSCAPALNGLHDSAREWVAAIEKLTLQHGLHSLTMLPWSDVLSFKGLLRHQKAWCEHCLEERRIRGILIYEPLLWSLEVVTLCQHHKTSLQEKCPFFNCGKTIPVLSSDMLPGFCPHCNRWVGRLADPDAQITSKQHDKLKAELNITQAVGEMLAITPSLKTFPTREYMSLSIARFIEDELNGNFSNAARRMQISRRSISDLTKGIQSPELGTLLRICEAMRVSPVELLTGIKQPNAAPTNVSDAIAPQKSKRRPRKFFQAVIRARLSEIIEQARFPPPTLYDVAIELDYDMAFLKFRVPDLCQIILDRHRQYEIEQKELRKAELRELTREKAYELHRQGIYPALHKVAAGGVGAAFKETDIRLYWKEVLAQLGFKD